MPRNEEKKIKEISVLSLYQMRGGIVRNEEMAISLARVIITGLYGEETLREQEPLTASSDEINNWVVRGSPDNEPLSAIIVISKLDASVSRVDVPQAMSDQEE